MGGWVKIHRSILDWQWWPDDNTLRLFLFLILTANVEDRKWRNITVRRGQIVTTLPELSEKTNLSIQSLRTCLNRLEESGEINSQATNKYRVITICKFDTYQVKEDSTNRQSNRQLTDNQQTTNRQAEKESSPRTPLKNKDIQEVKKERICYYYSLRALTREEKEQQQFFFIFYLKGAADPAAEVENFISWNTSPERVASWERCPEYARYSTASRWQVKGAKRPDFDPAAGKVFTKLTNVLNKGHPGILEQICHLTDRYPFTVKETTATLVCTKEIMDAIEQLNDDTGQVRALLHKNKIFKLKYAVIGPKT